MDRESTHVSLGSFSNQTNCTNDFSNCPPTTLEEIQEANKVGYCVVVATVVSIEPKYNWYYISCSKCKRKVHLEDNKYICLKCKESNIIAVLRYKLQVRVVDGTSSASFVLFDREALEKLLLISKEAKMRKIPPMNIQKH